MVLTSGYGGHEGRTRAGRGAPFSLSGVSCRDPHKDPKDELSVRADGAKSPG